MNWLDKQVSLYSTHADNTGRPVTLREILFSRDANAVKTIVKLRKLDRDASDYKVQKVALKAQLPCYTPAGLLASKQKGNLIEKERTGLMQLDFDYNDISVYDLEDLKAAVFDLPFIAYCGRSCSGDGFYCLALIAEPDRLFEYAEHVFHVFEVYGIQVDTSKGKKIENLRYLSYDKNHLLRENPVPLKIKKFFKKQIPALLPGNGKRYVSNDSLITSSLEEIRAVLNGHRWPTIQKVAYTLGGLGDPWLLEAIRYEIINNSAFTGEEKKYLKCANDQFQAGSAKPFLQSYYSALEDFKDIVID